MRLYHGNLARGIFPSKFGTFPDPYNIKSIFADANKGVWYDPRDRSTLYQDVAGTLQVTAAGQTVARMNDKSGNHYDLFQGNSAASPVYRVDANGNGYLQFTSNNFLMSNVVCPIGIRNHAGMIVYTETSHIFGGRVLSIGASTGEDWNRNDAFSVSMWTGTQLWFQMGAASNGSFYPGSGLTPLDVYQWYWRPTAAQVLKNGNGGSIYNAPTINTLSTGRLAIGGQVLNGSGIQTGSSAAGLDGKWYGGIVVGRDLIGDEQERLRLHGRSLAGLSI